MIEVILLYAILATVFPLGRTALAYSPPIFLTGIRMLLGGTVLLTFYYWRHRKTFRWSNSFIKPLLIMTLFNIYLTNVCEFWGLQYLDSGKACFIYNLSPFFAALFSYMLFAQVMTWKKWVGLIMGFLGFLPILFHETIGEKGLGGLLFFSWAELSLFVAAISTAYGWTVMRKLVHDNSLSPVFANGFSMLLGSFFIIPTSFLLESWSPAVTNLQAFIFFLLILTLISNIVGYNMYGFLLKKYTVTFLSFASFLGSLFATFYGWFFLNELITWHFFFSATLVCVGLIIFYHEELRQGYIVKD